MNIYIPEPYFENQKLNGYSKDTAPIFFPNAIGGYMPAKAMTLPDESSSAQTTQEQHGPSNASSIKQALAKGLVVASPGARGRSNKNAEGQYYGKAPAAIVDLKAAVRYLRANDKVMPGSAEYIISNGTSAGAALSLLLAASANSADYTPYLKDLGAAQASDAIYAASAYALITNLEHADTAYEWLFNGVNSYKSIDVSTLDYKVERKYKTGTLTDKQIAVSNDLKAQFPAYVNSLKLRNRQGELLTLDENGKGSFADLVAGYLAASAQHAMDTDSNFKAANYPWLTIKDGKVTSVDLATYAKSVERQKTPPAFDALDLSAGENDEFGDATTAAKHFTEYGFKNSTVANAQMADPQIVKMMNPLNYIERGKKTGVAPYWRIRHGSIDKDTSLAIPTIVATKLENLGYNVDYALAWDKPHSGDYDLPELFAWIEQITKK
ncbi:alpha/beta hydrolase [Psittacicella hinzii]|uniref:Alpha/beta hydrolase n=2 Tax=Psittacicella hinzii TaxID=2028575 RepID=A0A3A1YPJ3_9GAMM|nr:alpha/beta hydrolase [Psittacicella hinzii]